MKGLRKRLLWMAVLLVTAVGLSLLSADKELIERMYSGGFYPVISRIQRAFFGFIPFSIGDILYVVFFGWLIYKAIRVTGRILKKKISQKDAGRVVVRLIILLLFLYDFFMLSWGLNYSRLGIRYQLSLTDTTSYTKDDLLTLQTYLIEKVNRTRSEMDMPGDKYPSVKKVYTGSFKAYRDVKEDFPFLNYKAHSLKASLFGRVFNYLGFTGYYNPFTGEAQVNKSVPRFLLPEITLHEMAHQIGYAKEDEAEFVSFLVGTHSHDSFFQYSSWLNLFLYTNAEMSGIDSTASRAAVAQLSTPVRTDIRALIAFNKQYQSFMDPIFRWLYGNYLMMNEQPQGIMSYNDVVSLVVAYYKKTGIL